jgi:hypothetical protein
MFYHLVRGLRYCYLAKQQAKSLHLHKYIILQGYVCKTIS